MWSASRISSGVGPFTWKGPKTSTRWPRTALSNSALDKALTRLCKIRYASGTVDNDDSGCIFLLWYRNMMLIFVDRNFLWGEKRFVRRKTFCELQAREKTTTFFYTPRMKPIVVPFLVRDSIHRTVAFFNFAISMFLVSFEFEFCSSSSFVWVWVLPKNLKNDAS